MAVVVSAVDPDLDQDAGVILLVHARDRHGLSRQHRPCARHIELRAGLVELSAFGVIRRVQSKQLYPQQVLARRDASGDRGVRPSLVRNHGVDGPYRLGGVERLFVDLEPLQARKGCGCSVVDLGHVIHDGAFVGWVNVLGLVVGVLRSTDDVAPGGTDLVTGLDVDHDVGVRARLATGHVGVLDVCDRIVVGRGAETYEESLIGAIDGNSLSYTGQLDPDGMG